MAAGVFTFDVGTVVINFCSTPTACFPLATYLATPSDVCKSGIRKIIHLYYLNGNLHPAGSVQSVGTAVVGATVVCSGVSSGAGASVSSSSLAGSSVASGIGAGVDSISSSLSSTGSSGASALGAAVMIGSATIGASVGPAVG